MKPIYSGRLSKKFWKQVNSLPNADDRDRLYALGCALQNTEAVMLRLLKEAANPPAPPTGGARKET